MTLVARGYRQEFARLTLPLLGASFSGYSLELKYLGREARDDQQVDVVEAVAPDGFTARLFIDAGTHLPIAISWSAIPSIVITTGRASVRGGPSAPVEHAMLFSDFRAERGVKWPRAIREYAGMRLIQETRIEKVVFNPKLPPGYFSAPE